MEVQRPAHDMCQYPTDDSGRRKLADDIVASGFNGTTQSQAKNDKDKIVQMAQAMANDQFDWAQLSNMKKFYWTKIVSS